MGQRTAGDEVFEASLPDVFFRGPGDRVLEYSFDRQAYLAVHKPVAAT